MRNRRNSPRFAYGYDPKRILVGDVDGDGLADIVYVDHGKVLLWINQSGNQRILQPENPIWLCKRRQLMPSGTMTAAEVLPIVQTIFRAT